jgi:hypothetical protein
MSPSRSRQTSLALTLLAACLAHTSRAHADEPTEAPVQYRTERYPSEGTGTSLVLAGAAITLGSYGVAFGTSYLWPHAPTAEDLRLPIVGPAMAVAGAGCAEREREAGCSTPIVVVRTVLAAIGGIGQLGGLALIAEGLFLPTSAPSAQAPDVLESANDSAPTHVWISPTASDDGFGLSVGGAF